LCQILTLQYDKEDPDENSAQTLGLTLAYHMQVLFYLTLHYLYIVYVAIHET